MMGCYDESVLRIKTDRAEPKIYILESEMVPNKEVFPYKIYYLNGYISAIFPLR